LADRRGRSSERSLTYGMNPGAHPVPPGRRGAQASRPPGQDGDWITVDTPPSRGTQTRDRVAGETRRKGREDGSSGTRRTSRRTHLGAEASRARRTPRSARSPSQGDAMAAGLARNGAAPPASPLGVSRRGRTEMDGRPAHASTGPTSVGCWRRRDPKALGERPCPRVLGCGSAHLGPGLGSGGERRSERSEAQ